MADVSIQNARMHTRMLRTRYHPRNKIRMIPPKLQPLPPQQRSSNVPKPRTKIPQLSQLSYKTRQRRRRLISNKAKENPNRSHNVHNSHSKPSIPSNPHNLPPTRSQSESIRFQSHIPSRSMHMHRNSNQNSIMNPSVCAPKSSSLPVIIPKLRLKPIRPLADRAYPRHQSEPISSVNSSRRTSGSTHNRMDRLDRNERDRMVNIGNLSNRSNRDRHEVVLPKLQCLKSHRNNHRISPPKTESVKTVHFDKLSQQYFELSFLLRSEMGSVRAFHHTQNVATESLKFLSKLTEMAQSMGILRGTLSRALLPFDSNTSVADQANVTNTRSENQSVLSDIDFKTQQNMKYQAIALRQLVKVKIADDADLDQAKSALLTVRSFCSDTLQYCASNDMTLKDMLQKLKMF